MRPPGMSAFCDCSARATSLTDSFCARSSAGSSHRLICRLRPPITTTWPTPSELSSRRRSTLSANSVMSRTGLSAVTATVITGDAVEVELLDRRLQHRPRQLRHDAVDAVAHFLRGDVGVLLELERHHDLRDALGRGRGERVDAADGVDRLFDLVGDLGLDLLGRGAGQARRHRDGRDVDVRKAIDAEPAEREQADDGQREHEHPGEDGPPDADRGKPLHDGYLTTTRTPSTSCSTPVAATRSPAFRPLAISIRSPTAWRRHDDALFSAVAGDHEHARRAGDGADGGRGHEDAGTLLCFFDLRRGEEPGLEPAGGFGTTASSVKRARGGGHRRRDVAHLAGERLAGIGIHLEGHRAADGHRRHVLLGHGQLDAQRIDAHHRGHLGAARDVIADRHEAFADDTGERRANHRVGQGLLRHRDPRARAQQRLILLRGAVLRHFVLALGGFELRAALVELRLREQLVVVQPLGAGELAARQLIGGLGIGHFGHPLDIECTTAGDAQPRLDLRGVRLRLARLRFDFGGGDLDERVVGAHQAAALHRRGDDAPGDLGGDLGILLRRQRAAHANEPRDRLLDGGGRRHRDGDGFGRGGGWYRRRRRTRRGERRNDEQTKVSATRGELLEWS